MAAETILIVDDDIAALELCCTVLEEDGYHVLRATSGPEALEICLAGQHRIDLALVDVVMPQMTGIDLAKRLEFLDPTPKIALISGYTLEEVDRLIGDEGSTYRIFWKPYDLRIFLQMIRNVLDAPQREQVHTARG